MSGTLKPARPKEDKRVPRRVFPSSSRILRSADFRLVYDKGSRVSGPLFAAFCLARTDSTEERRSARLGLTVPKAVGNAVERNRIKRRLREAFRMHCTEIDTKWDIVLNPRRPVLKAKFTEVEKALRKVMETCASR